MSDRAAKQARRAKRKAKQAARARRACSSCGRLLAWDNGIEVSGPDIKAHLHCKTCFPVEAIRAFLDASDGNQVVIGPALEAMNQQMMAAYGEPKAQP